AIRSRTGPRPVLPRAPPAPMSVARNPRRARACRATRADAAGHGVERARGPGSTRWKEMVIGLRKQAERSPAPRDRSRDSAARWNSLLEGSRARSAMEARALVESAPAPPPGWDRRSRWA